MHYNKHRTGDFSDSIQNITRIPQRGEDGNRSILKENKMVGGVEEVGFNGGFEAKQWSFVGVSV